MNTHEYIRKTDVLKLIQDYMKNVPHSHLECLKTLENRLYKLSPVRASEVVEYLERENFGLHAKMKLALKNFLNGWKKNMNHQFLMMLKRLICQRLSSHLEKMLNVL